MKTLGVTGGIGSGKTTVCRLLEARGARVFYADAEAKRLMETDPALRADLVAAFGAATFDDAGRLRRKALAARVFGDAAALARLGALVHPRVGAAWAAFARDAAAAGAPLAVHEAALLYDAGGDRHVDAVLVVDAPEAVRVARAAARDGVDPGAVRARVAHQMPAREMRRRADFLVENDGDAGALERAVDRLWPALVGADAAGV